MIKLDMIKICYIIIYTLRMSILKHLYLTKLLACYPECVLWCRMLHNSYIVIVSPLHKFELYYQTGIMQP